MIEICNTHTITVGYQTYFFSHFTFKLLLAWNVFDCLLWVQGSGVMMVNIGTRVAPVNIAFYSSRNAALIERKMLQTHYLWNTIIIHWAKIKSLKQVKTVSAGATESDRLLLRLFFLGLLFPFMAGHFFSGLST